MRLGGGHESDVSGWVDGITAVRSKPNGESI